MVIFTTFRVDLSLLDDGLPSIRKVKRLELKAVHSPPFRMEKGAVPSFAVTDDDKFHGVLSSPEIRNQKLKNLCRSADHVVTFGTKGIGK
jgi:hypothetical protein